MPTYQVPPTQTEVDGAAAADAADYTADDLANVKRHIAALAAGKAVAAYEIRGRKMQYQTPSVEDLQKLEGNIEAALAKQKGHQRMRYQLVTTGKGV